LIQVLSSGANCDDLYNVKGQINAKTKKTFISLEKLTPDDVFLLICHLSKPKSKINIQIWLTFIVNTMIMTKINF